jgi:hypothetical protein
MFSVFLDHPSNQLRHFVTPLIVEIDIGWQRPRQSCRVRRSSFAP